MPDTPEANPLGAGGDVFTATDKISGFLNSTEPDPNVIGLDGNPKEPAAPVEANPETPASEAPKERDSQGRFVKEEPETEEAEATAEASETEEDPKPEGEDVEEEGEPAEQSEPEDESSVELARTVSGLAEQLGLSSEELHEHLTTTVKINGEESQVSFADLIKGHQMEGDYRRKTAEIADQRRTLETDLSSINSQRDHYSKTLDPLISELEGLVAVDQSVLQSYLDQGDLVGYEQAQLHAKQREHNLNAANQEKSRLDEKSQGEAKERFQKDVADNERRLLERRPAWAKDPAKGKERIAAIRQYLVSEGVPGDVVSSLYDATSIITAEKAMMWDTLQKDKPSKMNKVKTIPKRVMKPGPSKARENPTKKVHRANLNRFRKSGDPRDMAQALKSGGFVDIGKI